MSRRNDAVRQGGDAYSRVMVRTKVSGGAAAVLFMVSVACTATPPALPVSPSAVSAVTPTPAASTSAPLPSGTIAPPSAGVSARATRVAREHRYVAAAEAAVGRIWLIDLDRGTSTDVVVAPAPPRQSYFAPTFSASRDGGRLVLGAYGPSDRAALYLVDVAAGRVTLLYEDPQIQAAGALRVAMSPDGSRYAFMDLSGVRIGDTGGGPTTQLVPHDEPSRVGGSWAPLGWSPDQRWLAIGRGSETENEVAVVEITTGAVMRIGRGQSVSWRQRPPELLVSSSINAFGGTATLYTHDLATRRQAILLPPGYLRLSALAWHPSADSFLYTQAAQPVSEGDVYVRSLADQAATAVTSPRPVWDAWWSVDGSRIFAIAPRPDGLASGVANLDVLELPSGRVVTTVCRGDPRASCP